MKFSIIIPVRAINDYIRAAIPYYFNQSYKNFEIIIYPNFFSLEEKNSLNNKILFDERIKIIESGNVGPAEKRDLAIRDADGDVLAFIDDDAYPEKNWLQNSLPHFKDPNVGGVCGPAATPPHNSMLQKVSGNIYEAWICNGPYTYRYLPTKGVHEVDDYPSVNLLIKKDVFSKVGGFDSTFYPGEDTKLCLDIVHKEKKKIIYDPKIFVWHHRRPFGIKFFKQACNYAIHRGYFARKYPETSLRLSYFIPTIFVVGLIGGIFIWKIPILRYIYLIAVGTYAIGLTTELFKKRNILQSLLTIIGIFFTHVSYGIAFIIGLIIPKLKR